MLYIDPVFNKNVVEACLTATGIKTKAPLIDDHTLEKFVRHQNQRELLKLKGNVKWEGDPEGWRESRIVV
jgi:hypothetical protein